MQRGGELTEKYGINLKNVDVGGGVSYLTHSPAANTQYQEKLFHCHPQHISHASCSRQILAGLSTCSSADLVSLRALNAVLYLDAGYLNTMYPVFVVS